MNIRSLLSGGFLMISVMASALLITSPVNRNQAFNQSLKAALRQPVDYYQGLTKLEPLSTQDCRIYWQISILSFRIEELPNSESALQNMLECTPASVDWLLLLVPERVDLANRAVQLYPEEARVWFWLGDLAKASDDQVLADKYYTMSAKLDPSDGLSWCRLGRVKEQRGLILEAFNAFRQCCQNGDPGSNGCYNAGRMAEKMGDITTAIQYYLRSRWQPSLDRAEELLGSQ